MKPLVGISFIGVLVALLAVFVIASMGLDPPGEAAAARLKGKSLSLEQLGRNEEVVIVIGFLDPRRDTLVKIYQIAGGPTVRFSYRTNDPIAAAPKPSWHPLSAEEVVGLGAYLALLRRDGGVAGERRRDVLVGHYRDGQLIGEETLHDGHSNHDFLEGQGHLLDVDETLSPSHIPLSIRREIVPPWILEQRFQSGADDQMHGVPSVSWHRRKLVREGP